MATRTNSSTSWPTAETTGTALLLTAVAGLRAEIGFGLTGVAFVLTLLSLIHSIVTQRDDHFVVLLPETDEPLEVWTTLDIGMQRAATDAIAQNVPAATQGALVSMDRDGAVLAMVGGTDYVTSNYNRATNAVRQPGSAWKLFVYLAALEAGYTAGDEVVDDAVTIQGWSPRN